MSDNTGLPLGLFKQASMKLDSFISDIHEIKEDPDINNENKETLSQMSELAGVMQANLINIIREEMDEEEFLNEEMEMDVIDEYPGSSIDENDDLLDMEIM